MKKEWAPPELEILNVDETLHGIPGKPWDGNTFEDPAAELTS